MTTSPAAMARAPPEPPSPVMTVTIGTADPAHDHDRPRDRLGDAALLGLRAGVGARGVDEGDDGDPEAVGQLEEADRLAEALGLAHPEVAPDVLVGVGALLVAHDHDAPAVDPAEPAHDRPVVAEEAVAVELREAVGDPGDELQGVGPAGVAGQEDAGPDRVARTRAAGGAARRRAGVALLRRGRADGQPRRTLPGTPSARRRRRRARRGSRPARRAARARARSGPRSRGRRGTRRAGSRAAAPRRSSRRRRAPRRSRSGRSARPR